MRTSSVLLLAVAALALVAGATSADIAASSTAGKTYKGYTFATDTAPYLNISRDICLIKKVLNTKQPDYTFAKGIYMDGYYGKLASKDGGLIAMRRMATDVKTNEPLWTQYQKHFNNPVWLDDLLVRAFGKVPPYDSDKARVQLIVKTLESSLQVSYLFHELDQAINEVQAKKANASLDVDPVYRVDKAWAIFVGADTDCGLWTVSLKRATQFGTKKDCETSNAAAKIRDALIKAQKAAKALDLPALKAARDTVVQQISAIYVQAVISYAHEMWLDLQSKAAVAKDSASEHQVEAFTFYRTIAPLVAKASNRSGQALDFWLFPGVPVVEDVDLKAARAFFDAYKGLGVTPADIGVYGKKQPELKCKEYVAPPGSTGSLLTVTQPKDELRPAAPKGAAPAKGAAASPAAKPAAAKPAAASPAAKPAGKRRSMFFF